MSDSEPLQGTQALGIDASRGKPPALNSTLSCSLDSLLYRFASVTLTSDEPYIVISKDPRYFVRAAGNGRLLPSAGGGIPIVKPAGLERNK